jgi:Carboxypeptidase regulatory-like domain
MTAWMTLTTKRRQVAIAGRVIEAVTQQAIAKAVIKIEQSPPEFRQILKLKALQAKNRSIELDRVVSAIDGCFYFLDLPPGTYTLTASLPNTGTRYGTVTTEALTVSRNTEGNLQTAIAEIILPTTALTGTVTYNNKPVNMARIQVEGSSTSAFSNAEGSYLLTGLEVWQPTPSSQPPRPNVQVFARGYPPLLQGVQLQQGELTTLNFELAVRSPNSS